MAVGTVAVFKYHNGVSHVALVEELGLNGFTVSECNFHAGKCGWRFVPYNDYSIVSFWTPPNRTSEYLAESQSPFVADSSTTDTGLLALAHP